MFDEIARGKADSKKQDLLGQHRGVGTASSNNNNQRESTAALLQKRLSLVQQQSQQQSQNQSVDMAPLRSASDDLIRHADDTDTEQEDDDGEAEDEDEDDDGVVVVRSHDNSSNPIRYGDNDRVSLLQKRPVSIGSSSSSSSGSTSCGHRHHPAIGGGGSGSEAASCNPYLASVESLADTCASSQGSGDSGVVVTGDSLDSTALGKTLLAEVKRATAARYFDERRPRYCDPHRSPVERVLLEIVDTEDVYVDDLRQVIQGYLIFWRDDPDSLVRNFELNGLFSNIEDIYEFNSKFLSALEKSELDPIAIARTFIEHNAGFKVYTEYCTNYPRTVSILTDLMNQEKIGRAFRDRQAALGHKLPLGSFLLKPVQRILKYHLLLERLSKGFGAIEPCDEECKLTIDAALQAMNGIAEYINEMKRKHEHAVRVQEIQSLLYGWHGPDLTTSGELIAEGSFRMRGAKAPRHAFLFDKMLLLTKKREDGLLVYKAHILCSNLTLMESIPGEPFSFHVIPFDNSQIQYKLQARNLDQKREWTLQIKRVILENYSAVIPSHARQLVLQIGQKSEDDYTPERGHKKYNDRKSDRERRKSEIGIRQKLKKGRKSDISNSTAESSPMSSRKNESNESISQFGSRDENLNRSSEVRASKIKDRFTNWRRKSEPGFQSYINLKSSDNEDDATVVQNGNVTPSEDALSNKTSEIYPESEEVSVSSTPLNSPSVETKENNTDEPSKEQEQSVEEIVSNILMQKKEFQKRLEKHLQRNPSNLHNSILKYSQERQDTIIDSSEDEEYIDLEEKANGENNNINVKNNNNNRSRTKVSRREQCFVRAVNAYNQRSFRSQYDSFRNVDARDSADLIQRINSSVKLSIRSSNHERRSPGESFKKPNIVVGSKLMRTALRIREDCDSASEHEEPEEPIYEVPTIVKKSTEEEKNDSGTYDNLQNVWDGCLETDNSGNQECPNKAAVWLNKLCEGLPDQPQKCGSLPRSFQMMNAADLNHVSKSRFLQRDGKSMTERPFTIASDKPAEINLEDMERYASSCQGSTRIAKFPTTSTTSTSTFFCSLDDSSFTDTDSIPRKTSLSTSAYVHPDHKIYRATKSCSKETTNGVTTNLSSSSLLSVFSRAGSRLKSSQSTEVLECTEEFERSRYFRSFGKRSKQKSNVTKSTDFEEIIGCVSSSSKFRLDHLPYHKLGSSSIGARIAQSDYADPIALFSESRKNLNNLSDTSTPKDTNKEAPEPADDPEDDSFYEKSFDTIEDYAECQEEAFRDSAIFSDVDDSSLKSNETSTTKVPPPVPAKSKIRRSVIVGEKPALTQKPAHLKLRARLVRCRDMSKTVPEKTPVKEVTEKPDNQESAKEDDVSAGQSQVGWVKKMVGQLQQSSHVEA